jgi:D-alanine-D-alanine ligase
MKILHLVGSQASDYYYGVSIMYASGCIEALPAEEHVVLLAWLGGTWSIASSLAEAKNSERLSLPEALFILQKSNIDIMQPHMFCYSGMATMRSIAAILDVPLLGNSGHIMALTTNKWQSRAVVESVGVPVPKAQLLRRGDIVTMEPPFMLKPCREDNSIGVTLVQHWEDVEQALLTAFTFDDVILCEEFIPLGRELRVGVVEDADGNSLELLPVMEYFLGHKKLPIRTSADKIDVGSDGDYKSLSFAPVDRKVLNDIDEELQAKLTDLAIMSHRALGCEQYSLYDVRVDPDGNPFFIEASAYCSFSPKSAIVCMSRGNPRYNDTDLFYRLAKKAIKNHASNLSIVKNDGDDNKQSLGMRVVCSKLWT